MAAIKVSNYTNIAQIYTNAQVQVAGVADYYYDAAYEIVILQVFDPELDLLQPFYNAYLAAQTVYLQAPSAVISAVGALQRHILSKARDADGDTFTNVNDWLDSSGINGVNDLSTNNGRQNDVNTSIKIPSQFATLSDRAGFTITSGNIQSSS